MSKCRAIGAALILLFGGAAQSAQVLEDNLEQTYTLDPDAAISIKNADGSIRIYAAEVTEVHLHALKKAYTTERLNAINVDVKATQKSLAIETQMPPRPSGWTLADRSGTVEYTLIVPMTAKITACELVNGEILIEGLQEGSAKAHLVNGWLAAHNSFIDLDLSVVNGKLDVAYDWWQADKSFTANAASVNGSVRALIPPDASAAIAAESEHGHVVNSFADEDEPKAIASSVAVSMGDGAGAQVTLRSQNGNVRIDKSYETAVTK